MSAPHAAPAPPLIITLEMTRARAAGDPHAFAAGAQSYLLREAGGVYHGFELVWDQALAEDLYALSRPRTPSAVVNRLGERLREILQLVAWDRHDKAIDRALADGRRVIVDFLSAAAELYTLPWELVPLRSSGARLAELPNLLVRYAWPATSTKVEPKRDVGGKLLFVWSDAAAPVPWKEQEQVIRDAVASLNGLAPLEVDVLPRANPSKLKQALEAKPSVVHILCHGRSGADGGLVLHDALGHDEEVVSAQALGALLAPAVGHLQQLVLCACGSGAWSSVASPLGSLAQVAHRLGVPSVVAFRIPVTIDGAQVVTQALYDGLLRRLSSLEDAHLNAQSALVKRESLDWAALQLLARAEDGADTRPVLIRPYRGLLPFRRAHRPLYFGCERVIDEVVRELDALVKTPELPDLLFLAGASGVGKSSLLNAGVLPALEERWPGLMIQSMRPGATPLATLNQAAEGFGQGPTLLVIDQLEELFTNGAPKDELTAFAARLWEILGSGVRCIAAIRGDYLDRLGEIAVPGGRRLDSYAYDDDHRVFIGRLRPEELREAIVRPAAVVGLQFEPGLVERVLEEIGEEPGALPLVQHCMDQLWEHRAGRLFTLQAYEVEIGGVDGALSRHADAVLSALSEADQRLARRLLCELVVYRGEIATATRQRLPLAHLHRELRDEAAIARVLDALVTARLLVRDEGDPRHPATVEIAHEALVRRWPTLGQWLTEGAEARVARDWLRNLAAERVREPNFVLQGAQLVAAAEIRQRFAGELSDELLAFITASEAAEADRIRREREARDAEIARIAAQARRATRVLMVSVVVGIVVLGLIVYALRKRNLAEIATQSAAQDQERAEIATKKSERKVREAADAELRKQEAITREAQADERAGLAAERERLANTAMERAEHARSRATAEAMAAEQQAIAAERRAEAAAETAARSLRFAQTLRRMAEAERLADTNPLAALGVLREIQPEAGEHPEEIPGWSRLAQTLLNESLPSFRLPDEGGAVRWVRLSPTGEALLVARDAAPPELWSLSSIGATPAPNVLPADVVDALWSDDGNAVYTLSAAGSLQSIAVRDSYAVQGQLELPPGHEWTTIFLSAERFVVARADDAMVVWDQATGVLASWIAPTLGDNAGRNPGEDSGGYGEVTSVEGLDDIVVTERAGHVRVIGSADYRLVQGVVRGEEIRLRNNQRVAWTACAGFGTSLSPDGRFALVPSHNDCGSDENLVMAALSTEELTVVDIRPWWQRRGRWGDSFVVDGVTMLAVADPSSQYVAFGDANGVVGLSSLNTNDLNWSETVFESGVTNLVFTADGALLVAGSSAGHIALIDPELPGVIERFVGPGEALGGVSMSQDGHVMVTWLQDQVYVWPLDTHRVQTRDGIDRVRLAFLDSQRLYWEDEIDSPPAAWDVGDWEGFLWYSHPSLSDPHWCSVTDQGRIFYCDEEDQQYMLILNDDLDTDLKHERLVAVGHAELSDDSVLSDDGRRIATPVQTITGGSQGKIVIYDVGLDGLIEGRVEIIVDTGVWLAADLSADGDRLLVRMGDRFELWSLGERPDRLYRSQLEAELGELTAAWLSPHLELIIMADRGGVYVDDAKGEGRRLVFDCGKSETEWAEPKPLSEATAAVQCADGAIWLVDTLETIEPVLVRAAGTPVNWLTWAPDGSVLAVVDSVGQLWAYVERGGGWLEIELPSEVTPYWRAVFSPDSSRMAVYSEGGWIRWWETDAIRDPTPWLWSSTDICMGVEERRLAFGIDEAQAERELAWCLQRVAK